MKTKYRYSDNCILCRSLEEEKLAVAYYESFGYDSSKWSWAPRTIWEKYTGTSAGYLYVGVRNKILVALNVPNNSRVINPLNF